MFALLTFVQALTVSIPSISQNEYSRNLPKHIARLLYSYAFVLIGTSTLKQSFSVQRGSTLTVSAHHGKIIVRASRGSVEGAIMVLEVRKCKRLINRTSSKNACKSGANDDELAPDCLNFSNNVRLLHRTNFIVAKPLRMLCRIDTASTPDISRRRDLL